MKNLPVQPEIRIERKPASWPYILTGVVTVIVVLTLSIFFLFTSARADLKIISPLSDEEGVKAAQFAAVGKRTTLENYPPNRYFPATPSATLNIADLDISADAFAVMNRKTGEILLAKNLTKKLPIASITKIMTGLTTLEQMKLTDELQVSSPAAALGEATMGLTAGETVTVDELLWGALLPSGNDAAETIASGYKGGRTAFINAMNQKASNIGMFDTFYFNPTGLDESTKDMSNFSTCLDLLALTNYALANPKFAQIVGSHDREIFEVAGKHKYFHLYNILSLDLAYPGILGVKPGLSDFAKETLVSYAERNGQEVIIVLLGARNTLDEAIKLYDTAFPRLGVPSYRYPGRYK
jgi:D-alanyl-D-alanine carboxypeptidase